MRDLLLCVVALCCVSAAFGAADYCLDVGNTNAADAAIGAVTLKGESKTITADKLCENTKLRDLTDKSADVVPGNSYKLTFVADTCGNAYSKVGKAWIDWHQNGWNGNDLYPDDLLGSQAGSATWTIELPFTVPKDAKLGKTRLRLMLEETTDAGKVYPCAIFSYGGATDFSINVVGGSGSDDGGLSGGSILLIILFVCAVVYVIAGCAYKWKVKGTRGVESCPNLDFWKELPKYFMDGCRFTWSKILDLKARYIGGSGGGGGGGKSESTGLSSTAPKTYDEL